MKKLLLTLGMICIATNTHAQTVWYVRADGGTSAQCNGWYDAAYSREGSNQDCAFNHPYYVTGVIRNAGGASAKWKGGDTLAISEGSYMMGFGAPNTKCSQKYPYDCYMRPIPSGTTEQPTRILGKGFNHECKNPPEFWGTEKTSTIINMQKGSSNIEIECLEITDHHSCRQGGSLEVNKCPNDKFPYGEWAQNGILAVNSDNVKLTNVNVHGMAYAGLLTARISNWTMDSLKLNGNGQVGWHGEYKQNNSSNSGTIIMRNSQVNWNGCAEKYPEKISPVPGSCCSQGQTCYTDGIGMADSGGNYIIEDSEVSFNSEDGIDLLHVTTDPNSVVIVRRTRSEGNSGNNLKVGAANFIVENNILISGCNYIANNFAGEGYDNRCRAGGEPLAFNIQPGSHQRIYNNTIIQAVQGKNSSIVDKETRKDCNGTEKVGMVNNIWYGGNYQVYDDVLAGSKCTGWESQKSIISQYSLQYSIRGRIAGVKNIDKNPLLKGFKTLKYIPYQSVDLTKDSPVRHRATTKMKFSDSSDDFNHNKRGNMWDLGAIEYIQ